MSEDQDILRERLKTHLDNAKARNSSFSLRAFAKTIDVPHGSLSQFISGKRNFSSPMIRSIVEKITQNPEERKDLLEAINRKEIEALQADSLRSSTSKYESRTLTIEEFNSINEWYVYAVRTVLSLSTAKSDIHWIATELGIDEAEVQKALRTLFKLGLVELNSKGEITRTKKHIKTPDTIKKKSEIVQVLRKIHDQHIQHCLHSLHKHDPALRDITWMNVPTNPAKLDQAREIIRKCQDDILALCEDDQTTVAYRLTIQMCPIKA